MTDKIRWNKVAEGLHYHAAIAHQNNEMDRFAVLDAMACALSDGMAEVGDLEQSNKDQQVIDKYLDAPMCCNGYECTCGGETIRHQILRGRNQSTEGKEK